MRGYLKWAGIIHQCQNVTRCGHGRPNRRVCFVSQTAEISHNESARWH